MLVMPNVRCFLEILENNKYKRVQTELEKLNDRNERGIEDILG